MPKFPTDTPDITPALNDRVLVSDTSNGGLAGDVLLSDLPVPTSVQDLLDEKASISGQVFTGSISATNLSGTNTGDNATNTTSNAYALTTPDFYKYQIVRTVSSGNLTVALKNYLGNDPTSAVPVKIQIGDTVRTITSALSPGNFGGTYVQSGSSWFNMGSAELATKEVDLFYYACYDTTLDRVGVIISRFPGANIFSDFTFGSTTEKGMLSSPNINPIGSDPVVNIGRFNAILSAGAGYTWSIPATSVVVNSQIRETRWLDISPTISWAGSVFPSGSPTTKFKYKIIGDDAIIDYTAYGYTPGTTITGVAATLPFSTNGIVWKNNVQCSSSSDLNLSGGYLINTLANGFCSSVSAERLWISSQYKI